MADPGDDTVSLTYAELAARRGISPASAKRLSFRSGWSRTLGNDGLSRVNVPLAALTDPGDDPDDTAPRASDGIPLTALKPLQAKLGTITATLRASLDVFREALEQAAALAVRQQANLEAERVLRAALTVELADTRRRLDEVTAQVAEQAQEKLRAEHRATLAEADRSALQARLDAQHAERERAAGDVAWHGAEIDRLQAELAARRPWWRRFTG